MNNIYENYKTYKIITFGCQMNEHDSENISGMLESMGIKEAETPEEANIVVMNTCSVREHADKRFFGMLGQFKKKKEEDPYFIMCVCGCMPQQPRIVKEIKESFGWTDIVFGTQTISQFPQLLRKRIETGEKQLSIIENSSEIPEEDNAKRLHKHKALVNITYGCNNFCTYCVIPYTRGRIRSLPLDEMARQAAHLAAEGYRELVLTGIEIASYGRDLPGALTLADAVETVAAAAPQMRLRLGSLEPTVITENFCRRAAATGQVCRHFHLSLQSGCDRTLARMNRKYNTAEFLACVERLRRYFPGCALTADMITGFPGETEADQAAAVAFLEQVGFAAVHVFPYSRRPGTKADAMPEQLSHAVKSARAHEAQRVADACKQRYLAQQVGRILPVLFEMEHDGNWVGHSDNYCLVRVAGDDLRGVVKNVKISAVSDQMLVGDLV